MQTKLSWPRRRGARMLASVLLASAVGLGTVASTSAQSASPVHHGSPGKPPTRGVTVDQARAAIDDALKSERKLQSASPNASAALASNSVTAIYVASAHDLAVVGTAQDDSITVSRDAAGKLLVNGGAVRILGPAASVANTSLIDLL